ncbi:tRNA glutamyl-Q(34) synthetase GluQRS [Kocuria palustris]|uniref:tRNA glutamyl-Q(34) synthetase GluQRS n=1 Tax=Kocuria palustris TaxID=71999 RepID=UPI0016429676|nr:tRNA glutamyl-Q(34) synthetase GluQRS [Kocuria palustris]
MVDLAAGRYAPSPSGDLHLGNLRTAVLAWAFARSEGRRFVVRIEDLDRVREGAARRQLDDLAAVGLDWEHPELVQSGRIPAHLEAVRELQERGLVYECFCTRREIRQEIASAGGAPHGAPGAYPGTCRHLTERQRARQREQRPAALRLRAQAGSATVHDRLLGEHTGAVDDFVLVRGDGRPAYNLAVVVDDAHQGVDQVVRGDDLLSSAPRQAHLAGLLGLPEPEWIHVPLVLNPDGDRLAKRDGAVSLADLGWLGIGPGEAMGLIGASLGLGEGIRSAAEVLERFDEVRLDQGPWVFDPPQRAGDSD